MKNIDIEAKKIPAHNRNWKIFQKEFGIICLYNDFIEDEWFVELGKVEGPFKVQPDATHLKTLIAT